MASLIISGCLSSPDKIAENISGYWEISEVKKDGKIVKSYTYSGTIDYFELDSTGMGFRKKLQPKLDGSFQSSLHQTPFKIRVENGRIYLDYNDKGVNYTEQVKQASEIELIIENDRGFQYIYKPYEPLNIGE